MPNSKSLDCLEETVGRITDVKDNFDECSEGNEESYKGSSGEGAEGSAESHKVTIVLENTHGTSNRMFLEMWTLNVLLMRL